MQFSIDAAKVEDLDQVAILFDAYRSFYEQAPDIEAAKRYLKDRFENQESKLFWAKDATGKGLGFVHLYPSFSSISMQRLWILNDLFVAENARRAGVGEALMERAKQFAVDTKAKGLQLETGQNNQRAQSLYEKLGYVKNDDYFVYYLSVV